MAWQAERDNLTRTRFISRFCKVIYLLSPSQTSSNQKEVNFTYLELGSMLTFDIGKKTILVRLKFGHFYLLQLDN